MLSVTFGIVIIILWTAWILLKPHRKLPPGPKGKPIVGILSELDTKKTHQQFADWADKYGPIYSFKVFGVVTVVLNDVKLIREAFSSSDFASLLNDRPETFFGKYIVFNYSDVGYAMYDDATVKLRKAMHKGFHFYGDGVKQFENLMTKELGRLVNEIDSLNGKEVDPTGIIRNSVCLVISLLLLGEETYDEEKLTTKVIWEYLEALNEAMTPAVDTILQKIPALRFVPSSYRRIYLDVIEKRDNVLKTFYYNQKRTYNAECQRGLVDVYLRMQYKNGEKHLTDEQVMGLIIDSIGAGMITTSNGLLGILLSLLNNPDCIEKIREEIDAAVDQDRLPEFRDRQHTPYLEAAVLEGLRYINHFPLMPHSSKKDVEFAGYRIPKGAQIFANLWYIHHHPDLFPDPWTFKPERFLDESGQVLDAKHPTRLNGLMFGVGPRNCVGESLAKSRIILYLATLFQKFDIEMTSQTPSDPKSYTNGLILEPPPFTCKFIRRSLK